MDLLKEVQDWRYSRVLWAGLGINRKIKVIPADVPNTDDPATGTGELRAVTFIHLVIGTALNRTKVEVVFPHEISSLLELSENEIHEELGKHDLIILGAGHANRVAKLAIDRLSEKEPWLAKSYGRENYPNGSVACHWVAYRDSSRKMTKYASDSSCNPFMMMEDYGIFVVRPNCFSLDANPKSRVVLFYGAHTYGTEAAAHVYFQSSIAAEISRKLYNSQDKYWYLNIDGLVKVKGHPGKYNLTNVKREITIEMPQNLSDLKSFNPIIELELKRLVARSRLGFAHQSTWRLWLYISVAILGLAIYLHSFYLSIAAIILVLIQKASRQADLVDVL